MGDILRRFSEDTLDAIELLDSGVVDGEQVVKFFEQIGIGSRRDYCCKGWEGKHRFCQNGYSWIPW